MKCTFLRFLCAVLSVLPFALSAQSVTWAKDIAPILNKHCVSCHRTDGIGHFSLIGYQNAFAQRAGIAAMTASRQMPPWKADPAYRHFSGENVLSTDQISLIKQWVSAGAPAGNMNEAPGAPVFTTGSSVGIPDQVLKTPTYTMTASQDEYRCFVLPNGLNKAAYLRALEVIPSNHMAVHHVLIYEDTTGRARTLDARTPEPGYVSFGSIGVSNARLVGAWVPGQRIELMPPFMGIKLNPKADLVVQVHFPANAKGLTEQSTINLFYTPTTQNIREVFIAPLLNHLAPSLQNGPLTIPANTERTFNNQFRVPFNGSMIGVAPHMHLIGRSIEVFGIRPTGGDTIRMIRIPQWDFHWQGNYIFQKVQVVPAGTMLRSFATYDNTTNNPANPSNPPRTVSLGEATTDEMFLVYFIFMQNQPGDENIVLDSTLLRTTALEAVAHPVQRVSVSPNPASEQVQLAFYLAESTPLSVEIFDLLGQRLHIVHTTAAAGLHQETLSVADLTPGVYVAQVRAGTRGSAAVKFVVRR